MIYGSVCSGIEAATCAWHPLGWKAAFVSEIEAFPRAVLHQRWPEIPLHGDFTTIQAGQYRRLRERSMLITLPRVTITQCSINNHSIGDQMHQAGVREGGRR